MRSLAPLAATREGELGRRADVEARTADEALLASRLRQLGVRRPIVVHENGTVMVSTGRSGQLRIHRGYAYSSDRILKAIIQFVNAKNRSARSVAEREIHSFSIDTHLAPKRARRKQTTSRRDRELLGDLERMHRCLNTQLFGGELSKVPFRLSNRMRTRLGEVTVDPRSPRLLEITISRRHWERDGPTEVEKTLLHEMVHQWQAESGLKVDHGASFKQKARVVGVAPLARRAVGRVAAATV
jgi:hypothetical protein